MNKLSFDLVKTAAVTTYTKLRKISPELALAGGVACGVGAIVMTVVVSKKVQTVIEEANKELDEIQALKEKAETVEEVKDVKQMTWKAYNKMVWKMAKALAPVIGLEVASIALFLLSHGIIKKRYLNATEALASLTAAYNGYRMRVKEALGEEAEKVLMSGGKLEKNIQVEDDEGNVEKKTGSNLVIQQHEKSPYEFDFNRHTAPLTWSPNPDYSETLLRNTQNYFNDLLQTRGHVFLNEVLDQLGMDRTPAGQICGWIKGAGDNYIDFGYMDSFMRDWKIDSDLCKKNIHLNFNVDGPIWEMI